MSRILASALAVLIVAAGVHSQSTKEPDGALARVPADAVGFVHVRVGEVWKSEMMGPMRGLLGSVGATVLDAFEKRFDPPPSNIDAIAAYLSAGDEENPSTPGVVVSFAKPFDPVKSVKALLPDGKAMNHFGQKYTADATLDLAVNVIDNRTMLLTRPAMMPKLLSRAAKPDGPMKTWVQAAVGEPIFGAIDVASLPKDLVDELPEQWQPLTTAKNVILTGKVGKSLAINVRAMFADAGAAAKAEVAVRDAMKAARKGLTDTVATMQSKVTKLSEKGPGSLTMLPDAVSELFLLSVLKSLDDELANPPLKVAGSSLVMERTIEPATPTGMLMAAGVVASLGQRTAGQAIAKVGGKTSDNLKSIALAMHAVEKERGSIAHALYSKDGKKALLSWRVLILPHIGQRDLFRQFKLDQAWDSEDNKKLIGRMPELFIDPDAPPAREPGTTHYQVLITGGAGFKRDKVGTKLSEVYDGPSNTIMIAVASDPTVWTRPDDLVYEPLKPLPPMGFGKKPKYVAFFDGSVRALSPTVSERTLRALITRQGGELIGDDF